MSTVDAATRHARAGRYDTARQLLDTLGGQDSDDVAVLDLLARIHAQRGDLVGADACWARVEQLDPEHTGAREGRRRIRETWAGKRSGRAGVAAGAALVGVLIAAGGAAAGWGLAPRQDAEPATDPAVAQELARLREEVGELRSSVAAGPGGGDAAAERATADRLREIREALADPRWSTTLDARSVLVTFRDPVFLAGGAEASVRGGEALTGLAGRLGDLTGVAVTVVGHTSDTAPVPGGPYANNAEVGLARALAAAQAVASGSGIPLSAVDVASAGDVDPPYPNTDAAGRARNQTVTVTVEVVP